MQNKYKLLTKGGVVAFSMLLTVSTVSLNVSATEQTLTLTTDDSDNKITYGDEIKVTATSFENQTGTVVFSVDDYSSGNISVSNGLAEITFDNEELKAGSNEITATFTPENSGEDDVESGSINIIVNKKEITANLNTEISVDDNLPTTDDIIFDEILQGETPSVTG